MINVAVVGLGFMGVTHLKAWRTVPGVRLYAVVDADPKRLSGDLSSVSGNLGGSGETFDFSGVRTYPTLEAVLADAAIDAVDICLPTDQHAPAALAALRAGKHVLTEKPVALDAATAEALVAEATASGRILMAAHVLRFFPAYQKLAECVRSAGPVRSALFRRKCAAPAWSPWQKDPARSGGAVTDLLIHDADICIAMWGMPRAVRARGYCDLSRGLDVIHADLIYPGFGPVVISGGWHHPESYPFSMEFTVSVDGATFEWQGGSGDFHSYSEGGQTQSTTLETADPFAAELAYFAECVASGSQPERCPAAQSALAVALVAKMRESRDNDGRLIIC